MPSKVISGLCVLALLTGMAAAQPAPSTAPAAAPTSAPAVAPTITRPAPSVAPKPARMVPPGARPTSAQPTTTPPAAKPAAHTTATSAAAPARVEEPTAPAQTQLDFTSMLFVFMLATFIGIGVIRRVSRLLHTPLMSLTNAISAIAVVGAILVAGGLKQYPVGIRLLGAIALFCSMTNIISGFLITDRMLKMFKTRPEGKP